MQYGGYTFLFLALVNMDEQNFFSVDRLIEFGLGMGIAQQMVGMMNQHMQSMYVPGSIQSMPHSMLPICYVAINGQQIGPVNDAELSQKIRLDGCQGWFHGNRLNRFLPY